MNKTELNNGVVSLPGADIMFGNSVGDLKVLPMILLANEWNASLLRVNFLRRLFMGNIYHYLDLEVNKKVLPNLVGVVNLSGSNYFSFNDKKMVEISDKKTNQWVLLPSRVWFKLIHLYIKIGFRQFAILPSIELRESVRPAITSNDSGIVFLPNYKVMYSSIRDYFRSEFREFDGYGAQSGALNRLVDMEDMGKRNFFRFSVVRNPWARAQSAFMDKIGRTKVRENEEYFNLSIGALMQVEDVTFSDYVKFICNVPDSHSDPHWVSQYGKLYNKDKYLVDYIGRYENRDELISTLCARTKQDWDNLQNTNPGPKQKDKVDLYEQWSDCYDLIAKRYNDDIVNLGYKENDMGER